jgi:hypothetical protein
LQPTEPHGDGPRSPIPPFSGIAAASYATASPVVLSSAASCAQAFAPKTKAKEAATQENANFFNIILSFLNES